MAAASVTATFRFDEALNVFLAPERRGGAFACRCAAGATVKHMVEALGVPHTEVGTVWVNGEPAALDRRLTGADRVEVWPPGPAGTPLSARFVADAHLGGLAHLLRMAGFDTLYDNAFQDDAIVRLAQDGPRTVLTRDRELLKRREVTSGCFVRALRSEAQWLEVVARLGLAPLARPLSRCLVCNAPLRPAATQEAVGRVSPDVAERHRQFAVCTGCGRLYWEGSHWRRMRERMGALLARAGQR